MRDLPWSEFRTTVHIEVYRVKCPACGVKIEKVPLLPSKAPYSKRFEDAVGQACESAAARQVARRMGQAAAAAALHNGENTGYRVFRTGAVIWLRNALITDVSQTSAFPDTRTDPP